MANRYPESSVYHDVYQEGYVDATADTVLVMKSNGKAVRDYLRGVKGDIKCKHVDEALLIALTGKGSE